MKYSIKQVSEMTGLSIDTLRYYDKEGLLPNLKRKESGYRVFHEFDIEIIKTIQCFKKSDMQISDIKNYMHLFMEGESTIAKRYEMIKEQKKILVEKRAEMDNALWELEKVIEYSKKAMETDSEKKLYKRARELQKMKNIYKT